MVSLEGSNPSISTNIIMKVEVNRRSSNDKEWQELKKFVDQRDKHRCRMQFCMSIKEAHQMKIPEGIDVKNLDHAHIFSAGAEPSLIYNKKNVVLLSRGFHRRMDNYLDPVTGEPIDLAHHYYWWYRIYHKSTEPYNPEKDYRSLLKEEISE